MRNGSEDQTLPGQRSWWEKNASNCTCCTPGPHSCLVISSLSDFCGKRMCSFLKAEKTHDMFFLINGDFHILPDGETGVALSPPGWCVIQSSWRRCGKLWAPPMCWSGSVRSTPRGPGHHATRHRIRMAFLPAWHPMMP